jgi:dTDP-4-amino-4,6-dideoxygalactose transaminase
VNPHQTTAEFEKALCDYTGAPRCVVTTSCTMALLLSLAWVKRLFGPCTVCIPRYTYVGVGMSILNAGHKIMFRDEDWSGEYRLDLSFPGPYEMYDSARRLTSGMWRPDAVQCLSFHWTKLLSIGQGGAILLPDDPEMDGWMRRARFDGRRSNLHPRDDTFDFVGYHAYMSPRDAAEGLTRLATLPKHNADLPNSDYSDLSLAPIFGGSGAKAIAEAAE